MFLEVSVAVTIAGGAAKDGGPAAEACLARPAHVAWHPFDGSLLVCDAHMHRVRLVLPNRTAFTVAGMGLAGYSGDGGPATAARLKAPFAAAWLPDGRGFYVSDTFNGLIRRVNMTSGIIVTVLAGLQLPQGLAVDTRDGALYITDAYRGQVFQYRPGSSGVTIVAGTGSSVFSPDGPALSVGLHWPIGIAVDPTDGSLVVAEQRGARVRRIRNGTATTIAGTGYAGSYLDGYMANQVNISLPTAVDVGSDGTVYYTEGMSYVCGALSRLAEG